MGRRQREQGNENNFYGAFRQARKEIPWYSKHNHPARDLVVFLLCHSPEIFKNLSTLSQVKLYASNRTGTKICTLEWAPKPITLSAGSERLRRLGRMFSACCRRPAGSPKRIS